MCPPSGWAHTRVRPYNSFSYFYERNLILRAMAGSRRLRPMAVAARRRRPLFDVDLA